MRRAERALAMLEACPGVVTPEAMRWCGVSSPDSAVSFARMLTTSRIVRVSGLGWRLER